MDMEIGEEFIMGSDHRAHIVKGRRTKHRRSSSPYTTGLIASSSSGGCTKRREGKEKEDVVVEENGSAFSSTTTSSDVYESTEEEEDMANCLILLAQGDVPRQARSISNGTSPTTDTSTGISKMEKFSRRKFSGFSMSSTTSTKASFYAYECKTCNRSFPSFQALGGHRASHKKPKTTADQETTMFLGDIKLEDCSMNKKGTYCLIPDDHHQVLLAIGTTSNMINPNSNKGHQGNSISKIAKVHECSICGSEFNSGQALGGHMRRHRANTANNSGNTIVDQVGINGIGVTVPIIEELPNNNMNGQDHATLKPGNVLSLDLNLPALEDDNFYHQHHHNRESKFEFLTTKQAMVFLHPYLGGLPLLKKILNKGK